MKATQKLLLLTTGPDGTRGLAEVDDLLRRGWRVAQVCPMGGGGAAEGFAAAVVLERSGSDVESVLEQIEEEIEESIEGDGAGLDAPRLDLPADPDAPSGEA